MHKGIIYPLNTKPLLEPSRWFKWGALLYSKKSKPYRFLSGSIYWLTNYLQDTISSSQIPQQGEHVPPAKVDKSKFDFAYKKEEVVEHVTLLKTDHSS